MLRRGGASRHRIDNDDGTNAVSEGVRYKMRELVPEPDPNGPNSFLFATIRPRRPVAARSGFERPRR
jgi:hypothetical protein